jgi:hypothetical protein
MVAAAFISSLVQYTQKTLESLPRRQMHARQVPGLRESRYGVPRVTTSIQPFRERDTINYGILALRMSLPSAEG